MPPPLSLSFYLSTSPHGVIYHNTNTDILTAVRNSNLMQKLFFAFSVYLNRRAVSMWLQIPEISRHSTALKWKRIKQRNDLNVATRDLGTLLKAGSVIVSLLLFKTQDRTQGAFRLQEHTSYRKRRRKCPLKDVSHANQTLYTAVSRVKSLQRHYLLGETPTSISRDTALKKAEQNA
jgi:hypothetical protein